MSLEEDGEDLACEMAFWLLGLEDPSYPLDELGKLSLELSCKFRALAIMALLVKDDSDRFLHNLIRSGLARETYLRRVQEAERLDDHHRCSGRYEALLDSIAAGELELARRIVSLSPKEWRNGHEYEDDYCYAQILSRLVQVAPPEEEIHPIVDQFETYLNGESNARFTLCRALLARDQNVFNEAFDALLDEQEAKIEADKVRGELEEPQVVAQRQVFVEGLAILRLAEKLGLITQQEYKYCPSLARVPMQEPFPGE